ncbi:MAG TPA: hypothetical protein PKK54_01150 [bacterium]|nr:hypothetical protein [bacterium]
MNKKQHTILNMSLLPLAVIILLIIGVGYFLLKGEVELPKFNRGPQIKRLQGYPTVIDTTKDIEKIRKVLKNETELGEFLNTIDSSGSLTVKDSINFDKEVVIAVTTSTNEEDGHKIKIAKVYEKKDEKVLLVRVDETEMGEGCETEKEKNVALDLAVLTKTDWEIDFERKKIIEECRNEEEEIPEQQKNITESDEIN